MRSTRTLTFTAFAVGGALLLGACGDKPASDAAPAAPSSAAAAGADGAGAAANALPAATDVLAGTAKTANAPAGTGDWVTAEGGSGPTGDAAEVAQRWIQLTAARAGDLDPVLVNGAGLTLYRFDEDSASPSESTCEDACAEKWPPVTVNEDGRIFLAGVAKDDVGVVERADGRLQITVAGWPVYRFAQDTEPGDTKGQGVGGTWFGVRPDGKKSDGKKSGGEEAGGEEAGGEESQGEGSQGEESGGGASEAPEGSGGDEAAQGPTATRVTLFSGTSFNVFDDSASSQVIEAATAPEGGCVNAIDPGTASSIAFDGLVKVWTGPDCTGESKILGAVDAENVGGVSDLRDIGLNNKIASVKLPG